LLIPVIAWLGACSLINQFDDVKPAVDAGGAAGTSGGGTNGGASGTSAIDGSTGGSAGNTMGGGGTAGASGNAGLSDSGPADTPPDAPRPLVCRFTLGSAGNHKLLADFSTLPVIAGSSRTLGDHLFLLPFNGGNQVRILGQFNGQQNTYVEYFASDSPPFPAGQTITSNGRLLDVHRLTPTSIGALVESTIDRTTNAQIPPQFELHTIRDGDFGPMPGVTPLTASGELGTSGSIEGLFSPDADGNLAIAASFQMPGTWRAAFGLFHPTNAPIALTPVFDNVSGDAARPSIVLRVRSNGASYAFYGESPQVEYEFKDDLTMPGRRPILGNGFVVGATLDLLNKLNIAVADLGTMMAPHLQLKVGQFDPSAAMTFDPMTLVIGKEAASLLDVPIGSAPGFTDDALLMAGPTGISRKELSILILDVYGHTRAEQKLDDTAFEIGIGALAPRGGIGGIGGKYHVVWTETHTDPNGSKYDILYYDLIECL
jgi:hypothetical protein